MTGSTQYIWLIGASEGIGAALAVRLAAEEAQLALSARSAGKLGELLATLPHGEHTALPMDVTDAQSVQSAWNQLHTQWPRVDMIIYNVGAYTPMDALHFELKAAEQMVETNFTGALRVLGCVLPYFVERNKGHIALVASVAGYRGLPGAIGYGASKAALIHLAENLKADLAHTGIAVQVINPGFVATRLTAKNDFPMPCIITPEKAADYIAQGLKTSRFEIHFPRRFSYVLKALALLPAWLYFAVLKKIRLR